MLGIKDPVLGSALDIMFGAHAQEILKPSAAQLFPELTTELSGKILKPGKLTVPISARPVAAPRIAREVPEGTFYTRPNGEKYYPRPWGEHIDVEVLRTAREHSHYVLLFGAPGCGKTALVEAAFDKVYTILGTGDTELSDFIGSYIQTPAGGFEWVDGPLLKAAIEGIPLLIDEVGLIDPKILSGVYGLMDGRKEYTVTANPDRGTVKAIEGFFVIAATNPNAPGVRLSEALLSRFTVHAEMTTDWNLAKKLGVPSYAVTIATNLHRKMVDGVTSWCPQMRELLAYRDLEKTFGTAFALNNLIASAPEVDRVQVTEICRRASGKEAAQAAKI